MKPNLDHIFQIADGDIDFQQKMIGILKKEFPVEKNNFLIHFDNGDYKKAAGLVHKIKHKISIFGLTQSYHLANVFEENLRNGEVTLYSDFNSILTTIETFLKEV